MTEFSATPPRGDGQEDRGADAPARFTLVHGLAALTALLGAAMIVGAIAGGGGPFSYGVVIGVIFLGAGLMRLRLLNLKARR